MMLNKTTITDILIHKSAGKPKFALSDRACRPV